MREAFPPTVHVKRMQQLVKFVRHFLIKNCAALLWSVWKALGYVIVALFAKCATFSQQKAPHPWIAGTLQDGALRHGYQSVALPALYKTAHCGTAIKVWHCRHFTRRRTVARPSKCGTAGTLQDGALRHGHQSVALPALYKTAHCGTAIKVWHCRHFTRRRTVVRPSKCGTAGTLQDGALRHGHQSVALPALYKTAHCGTAIKVWHCRHFTRRRTAARPSKCGTFDGRKAAHMPPCFQVPLWCTCCILYDAYRRLSSCPPRLWKVNIHTIHTLAPPFPLILANPQFAPLPICSVRRTDVCTYPNTYIIYICKFH